MNCPFQGERRVQLTFSIIFIVNKIDALIVHQCSFILFVDKVMDCRFEKEGEIKRKGSLINFFRIALFFGEIATLYQTEWRRSINTTLFLQNVIDLTGHTIRPMIFHLHRGGET